MTHEADNTNFAMSLLEAHAAEAAFSAPVSKAKLPPDHFGAASGNGDHDVRLRDGRWAHQDKIEWECGTCTFLNQPLFLSCEMCGQKRASEDISEAAIANDIPLETAADQVLSEAGLPLDTERQLMVDEEERLLKKERIKEIMALQQGIFNKIREENEDLEASESEGSFAWVDLEDDEEFLSNPSRVSCSVGYAKDTGGFGKKPPPMDASSNTVSTAAMSSIGGSSRHSLDWSANSQHSRTSATSRNSGIPLEQAMASLKEDTEQAFPSRDSVNKRSSSRHQNMPALHRGRVDVVSLGASLQGISVQSLDEEDEPNQSVPTGGNSSNRSIDMPQVPVLPSHIRRRATTSALDFDGTEEEEKDDRGREWGTLRHTRMGTRSRASSPRRSAGDDFVSQRNMEDLPPLGMMSSMGTPKNICHEDWRQDLPGPPQAVRSTPKNICHEDWRQDIPGPPQAVRSVSLGSGHTKTLFTGLARTPKGRSEEGGRDSLIGSLHRGEGKLKIPSPSLVPTDKKKVLTSPRDPVFSRNLYTDRKREAEKKKTRSVSPKVKKEKSHSVAFPLMGRLLRKKSHS